jgi:hypothetical protein
MGTIAQIAAPQDGPTAFGHVSSTQISGLAARPASCDHFCSGPAASQNGSVLPGAAAATERHCGVSLPSGLLGVRRVRR